MPVQDAIRSDVRVRLDLDRPAIGRDDDSVGHGHAFRDENAPSKRTAVEVRLDPGAPGDVARRSDPNPGFSVQALYSDPMPKPGDERADRSDGSCFIVDWPRASAGVDITIH